MYDSEQSITGLRGRLTDFTYAHEGSCQERFASGHASLDAYLDGGLLRGQLHEIFAASAEDNGSAAGFAAMLALRAMQPGKSILWLRTLAASRKGGRFNPAGFVELGGDPLALFMVVAPDEAALLRSTVDALRCDSFGAVVIECCGSPAILDLTASRRLTLTADRSGVTPLMLRLGAREQPSTASTRWKVRSALSSPLEANAPGHPTLDLTLLRRRSGPSGKSWRLEWSRDSQRFQKPHEPKLMQRSKTLSGAMVPFFGVGQAAARERSKLIV